MQLDVLDDALELLEKANADLEPELMSAAQAREAFARYARAERLASYGLAALARKIDDTAEYARTTGTSVGKARQAQDTARRLRDSTQVAEALKGGAISLDQASEITKADEADPGAATKLLRVAQTEPFHVLRDEARKTCLEAERKKDLADRQRRGRCARSRIDDLGMINISVVLEPHVGAPIVNRAEAEADRLYRKPRKGGAPEPFEAHLADAYAALFSGSGGGRPTHPELVVLVSHEVAKRGWADIRDGEVCKIPGIGPISPRVARDIAGDAFLSGVLWDGKDLRQFRRWTRNIPVEVRIALELGIPPGFDGIACSDCGNRFRTQRDHVEPHVAGGPASTTNLEPRCWCSHKQTTKRDRAAGKLRRKAPQRGPP